MIKTNDVVKYAALPGFLPRLYTLFATGFEFIALYVAIIFSAVGLIPANHAFFQKQNAGKYGLRHVIAEAGRHLEFKKKNIDQIVIFFTIITGILLLFTQIALLIVSFIATQPAFAQEYYFTIDGSTVRPDQDIAFIMMDRIFGLKGIFDSCISTNIACLDSEGRPLPGVLPGQYPYPFHVALHTMLQFYSIGIFIISVMVILYYVAAIAGETAQSGTPFGQRFNKTWAPVRLIMFLALIMPLNIGGQNAGLNAAQLIVFYAAKAGSNFATNAWVNFNQDLTSGYLGDTEDLVALPNIPELSELTRFMFVAKTCKIAEEMAYNYSSGQGIQAYVVRPKPFAYRLINSPGNPNGSDIVDYWRMEDASFTDALKFNNYGNITVRFGDYNEEQYRQYSGNVKPTCGEVSLRTAGGSGSPLSGVTAVQETYYDLILQMWNDPMLTETATCVYINTTQDYHPTTSPRTIEDCKGEPERTFINNLTRTYHEVLRTQLPALIEEQADNPKWAVSQTLLDRGWAGAAIWFNRIAELNGDVTTAVLNIPRSTKYPAVLELISERRKISNKDTDPRKIYDPMLPDGERIDYPRYKDEKIAVAMFKAYSYWDDAQLDNTQKQVSHNIFIDTINLIFGTYGLFDMFTNADKHPLAQLSTLGKGIMEATARNLAIGLAGQGLGKLFDKNALGNLADTAGTFLYAMGLVTLSVGVILFYVLPFMPFIYFIFAVSGWIKSIFEAIVAMPLWALAHLQIDGEGLISKNATNGYFLILEIVLRPILIVFGLLASVSIFAASVEVLNEIFGYVVNNVSGFDFETANDLPDEFTSDSLRAPFDQLFYTILYAAIVYLLGISCFKLIDLIPDKILRWAGNTAATFQENAGDPAGQILQRTYQGTVLISGKVQGGRLAAILN